MNIEAIFSRMKECITHKSGNMMCIWNEHLQAMELCIYHGIKVHLQGSEGERISKMCQCTHSQSWCGRLRWKDWVWVKNCQGRRHGALNGRLLWQLQQLFKIKLLYDDGSFIEFCIALALTSIPENSGIIDPVWKYVQVRNAPASITLQVFSVEIIIGSAYVIPQIATSSKTGNGWNKWWIVNRHIDLVTWKKVYK